MSKEKDLARLNKSGVLASWSWPQDKWDEMAKYYTRFAFDWKKSSIILLPFSLIAIFLLSFLQSSVTSSSSVDLTNTFTGIALLIALSALLLLFYRWFHIRYFPKPSVGKKPSVLVSAEGIIMSDRSFFWDPPALKINEVSIKKPEGLRAFYAIFVDVAWGMGLGRVIIPVPSDKKAQAETVIEEILRVNFKRNLEKGSRLLDGQEEKKWLEGAHPIADQLLKAIKEKDCARYMPLLNEDCKKTTNNEDFLNQSAEIMDTLGPVIKRYILGVWQDKNITSVCYNIDCEKKSNLTLSLGFENNDTQYKVQAWDLS